jgi:protein disulfide-isomerase A6
MKVSLLLTYLFCVASAFYDKKDDVVELTEATFQAEIDSGELWIVEFYAPWCGHCKNLTPEWKKLGTALKGIVKVGAVDATKEEGLSKKYGVQGFPTILAISKNLAKPVTFESNNRDATALAGWSLAQVKEVVKARLGVKSTPKKAAAAPSKSDVVEATQDTFDAEVMQYDGLVLAEFYAPWCGHCKNLAPEWKKAATALKGKGVKLVAVDATIHGGLASKYGVQGYPTIKVFAKGPKGEPTDFQGPRDSEGIVATVLQMLGEKAPEAEPSSVVELTEANFDEQVMNSSDLWLVEFFAPWCGHCKTLAPHWRTAAAELEGRVKVAAVDVTVHKNLQDRFKVTGFPTIKVFGADKTNPEIYEGARTSAGIVSGAEELLKEMQTPPRSVVELTSDEVLHQQCATELCMVAFLPHILDSGAEGRQVYLNLLANEARKAKKQNLGFVWSEATSQAALESALEVGEANYPSLQAVSLKKGLRIPFQSAFSTEGVADFIKRVASGKAAPVKVKAVPKLNTITPWDGKDAPKMEL